MKQLLKAPLKHAWQLYNVRKLFRGIRQIQSATLDQLRDTAFMVEVIRSIGLKYDERDAYGREVTHMNTKADGLWQIPQQIAGCLICLSSYRIESFLEIGTSVGWTSSVMSAYLRRFNPNLRAVTVDPAPSFRLYDMVKGHVPLSYAVGKTSDDFKGQAFDLCFIDGDHSFEWVSRDYENVGKLAKISMFHDINDDFVSALPELDGGVRRFWKNLLKEEADEATFREFIDHSDNGNFLGIGLRIKNSAEPLRK
jgi:hypothetical protein